MARNMYPGYCYRCGVYVPAGYGHFERRWGKSGSRWQIQCVKCASGRIVTDKDPCVQRAIDKRKERENQKEERK